MKLREFTREKARNFVLGWSAIYFFFALLVMIFFLVGTQSEVASGWPAALLWPHIVLGIIVLFSLLIGLAGMWSRYNAGQFDRLRAWRNIPFYVILFIYPLGILINLLLTSKH